MFISYSYVDFKRAERRRAAPPKTFSSSRTKRNTKGERVSPGQSANALFLVSLAQTGPADNSADCITPRKSPNPRCRNGLTARARLPGRAQARLPFLGGVGPGPSAGRPLVFDVAGPARSAPGRLPD